MAGEIILEKLSVDIEWTVRVTEVQNDFLWPSGCIGRIRYVRLKPGDFLHPSNGLAFVLESANAAAPHRAGKRDWGRSRHSFGRRLDVKSSVGRCARSCPCLGVESELIVYLYLPL